MSISQKIPKKHLIHWLFLATLVFIVGCKDNQELPPPANQYLVDATLVQELSQADVVHVAETVDPILAALVRHGVRLYRVTYKTVNVDGSEIEASGAIAFPVSEQAFPMLSVQHGTITSEASAPSNLTPGSEFMKYGSVFAAFGYIAVFPDYIGYGASKHLPHPYEHRESLGRASLDMLRAARELISAESELKWDNRLYISGFSEGGYATLSLQKMLEENGEFNLKASTCGAGAYNKTAFMNHLINNETHGNPAYNGLYLWVVLGYNWIYGLNYPVSHFFREPYAAMIGKDQHLVQLEGSFHTMLQPSFVQGINEGTETDFIAAIEDNDLTGWKPVTPTQLYHGTNDQLVFYFNTETTYQSMKALGATSVELKTLDGKDHSTAVMDYLIGSYSFFSNHP